MPAVGVRTCSMNFLDDPQSGLTFLVEPEAHESRFVFKKPCHGQSFPVYAVRECLHGTFHARRRFQRPLRGKIVLFPGLAAQGLMMQRRGKGVRILFGDDHGGGCHVQIQRGARFRRRARLPTSCPLSQRRCRQSGAHAYPPQSQHREVGQPSFCTVSHVNSSPQCPRRHTRQAERLRVGNV